MLIPCNIDNNVSSLIGLKILLLFVCFCLPLTIHAQEIPTAWMDWLDRWQESADEDAVIDEETMSDLYESLITNPINLNDTLSDDLRQLPFVGDLRCRILKAYIEQHGQLLSVDELYLLNGFDHQTVEMLKPIVVARPLDIQDTLNLRQLVRQGHSQLLIGGGTNIEKSRGYREGKYEGNPLRLYARYQYHYKDKLKLSLSADKDPGEAFFAGSQPQGFDFYSGHLILKDIGIVKDAIVGHYNLQFGQGLTLWTGFSPYGLFMGEGCRYARGIAPASAFAEYGYLQGAATTVSLSNPWELSAFYSNVARDASSDTNGAFYGLSSSGYHRTASELAKKDALREQLYGVHGQYRTENLMLGVTFCRTLLSDSIVPKKYAYNYHSFSGDENFNIGIDGRFRFRHLSLYGEISLSQSLAFAALGGASLALSPEHAIELSIRHYDRDYYNLHNAPLARASGARGEEGVCLGYRALLPGHIDMQVEVDGYRLSDLRYGIYAPSTGAFYRISLGRQLARQVRLSVSYSRRDRARNASFDTVPAYLVAHTLRRQLSADLVCESEPWHFRTRLAQCWFDGDIHPSQRGFFLSQDVQYTATRLPLTLTSRFLLFDVDGYEARLYAAESDLAYQFSSVSYYGRGLRFYLVARYALSKNLTLSAKYAITTYPDVETVGSSYEQIDGDHRQSCKVQLRWNF